ncbi:DUF6907 domain-containing protein [Streptomyces sp. NPDC091292]|uniref:DUF6907 domain-containing protein n=1 Tax=Streptomyces sp. NPDC091292 TaxID=3365991 RepID=UPI00380EF44E
MTALVNGAPIPTLCPTRFCKQDHAGDDATGHVVDIDHTGAHIDLMVPDFFTGKDQLLAFAFLGQDLHSEDPKMREPHLRVDDGGSETAYLSLDQADEFADRLEAFAVKIRAEVRTGRGLPPAQAAASRACWERREGYDPIDGQAMHGEEDPESFDFLPCTLLRGHDGDHRDCLSNTWPQPAEMAVTA